MRNKRFVFVWVILLSAGSALAAGDGNRLAYLDEFPNPYYVGLDAPKLVTPQWIGEPGVDAAIVLSIDDMNNPAPYETYLRPILERLKKIDGRAPVSIMTTRIDPEHPHLQKWLKEGLSIEPHTHDHPCPCLQGSSFQKAKATYDASIDVLSLIPNTQIASFRMPCCDSMNSMSPRFFAEIFNRTTPQGNFTRMDSSVFMLFTPGDADLPRDLVIEEDGRHRFDKYVPRNKRFVNYVENYPYPYVIGRLCWEIPSAIPDDWQGHNLQGPHHATTVGDMKAAIDATVAKHGTYVLTFHPGGWIRNDQVVDMVDHAVQDRAEKVKFLNFRDMHERLTKNVLGGHPLRADDGGDNGVRLLDVNADGYMDAIVANDQVRQTRIWSPSTGQWRVTDFPAVLVTVDEHGYRGDAGVRFGVLREDGFCSILVRNAKTAGLWHFDGERWVNDARGLNGLDADAPVFTSSDGFDRGVRLRDLDADGICELIVGNHDGSAVFRWLADAGGWNRLPFGLPADTAIVDSLGRDAGLRLVDVDVDTHPDIVFSNGQRYGVYRFVSMATGWSQTMLAGRRGDEGAIPEIVRADGTNNGAWFSFNHMWIQNEDTGGKLPHHIDSRHFTDLLGTDRDPPARTPDESLQSFEVLPGFQVELVAAEPLVMDPVDIAWGPDGKMWVVEYADYPLGLDNKGIPCGRIRCLEDADGDGRYERSTVFLEPIACPMGVMVWRNGVLVTAAPDVFYAEDTDGDGQADVRKTLFTGFGQGNQQHRVNHPRWGLDNWVHAANGDSGGAIKSLETGQTVNISGRDLRFKPDEGSVQAQAGQTQFGTSRDDWGNWFGCNNSELGWLYALKDHYLRRNPHVAPPSGRVDVTPEHMLYPAGRVISHCDLKHRQYADWGKPGRCTSVASVMIYRDDLFGPHFAGNLFVDDSVFNVVHREILKPNGLLFRGERSPEEQQREFLATHDIWFRPSTVETGPDGALWVLDMYRFVIEHPEWINDDLEKTLDLRAGHDKGRIYRIYPVDKRPRPIPRLDKLDTAELVAALDSPSGWQRDIAHQMLLWRADPAAVEPLEKLVAGCQRALARVHALCVLDGLGSLQPAVVTDAFGDEHPGVRQHAVRVSESLLNVNPAVGEALLELEKDDDSHVQMQLAYSLGEWDDPRAGRLLGRLAIRHADDRYITAAIMSSATVHIDEMIAEVMAEPNQIASRAPLITSLMSLAVGLNNHTAIGHVLKAITARPPSGYARWQYEAMARLLDGSEKGVSTLLSEQTGSAPFFAHARIVAVHDDAAVDDRTVALTILGRGPSQRGEDLELLAGLLAPQTPLEVQLAAVETMGRLRHDRVPDLLLQGWAEQSPKLNSAILEVLISRKEWSGILLDRVADEPKMATILGTAHRDRLSRHPDEAIRKRAESLLGGAMTSEEIQASLDKFVSVADLKGDPVRGKEQFVETTCSYCHLLDGVGSDIAIDLRTLVDKSPGALLVALVDPNRAVEDKYIEYTAITADGLILAGMLVEETSTSITLADNNGKLHVVLRRDLDELISMGRSHMPEKLEAKMDLQQMADLFAFIAQSGPLRLEVAGNRPTTVTPGPDGSLELRAALCEIYSPGITMGAEHLVWFYKSPNDHVVWNVDVPKAGRYEVWIDWSQVDQYADNPIAIEVEGSSSRIITELPSTGGWGRYQKKNFGEVELDAGRNRVRLRPNGPTATEVSDLRGMQLVPVGTK